jgi:hypothetical protein
MKQTTIQLRYDSEQLDALRIFLAQKNLTIEAELERQLDALFEKQVPKQVQEYLLNKPSKQIKAKPGDVS